MIAPGIFATRCGDFNPIVCCVLRAEVTKALRARKNEKMQRCEAIRQQHEQLRRGDLGDGADQSSSNRDGKMEKDRHRGAGASGRGRHWRPALQSIAEAASQSSSFSESNTS